MKTNQRYLIACAIGLLTLVGCKSSQQAEKSHEPTVEDFNHRNGELSKAVMISQTVDVRLNSPGAGHAWVRRQLPYSDDLQWETTVEDKMLLLNDEISCEPYSSINYFYPRNIVWNPMLKCEIWLYNMTQDGTIKKRKIKKKEIVYERVNDSIGRMRVNIHQKLAGKILVRRYTLINPYLEITEKRVRQPKLNSIPSWTFQQEIPLLYGKYEIRPPIDNLYYSKLEYQAIKLGSGEMSIKSSDEASKVKYSAYNAFEVHSGEPLYRIDSYYLSCDYKAKPITATVSNVMPLPGNSHKQPLGIKIIYTTHIPIGVTSQ